jgi:OPA family glycerol-3-phosphate transporter-like MFS transporter
MSPGLAAKSSASFPLLGGFSVLLAGFLGDRVRKGGRAAIIGVGMVLTALALVVLARIDPKASIELPIALVGLIGFLLIGPYSYIAGAVSLDLGGKRGGATTCGIMDFVGYLGGAFAGRAMAGISVRYGWQGAFELLAIVAGVSAIAAGVLVVIQQSRFRPVSSDDRS